MKPTVDTVSKEELKLREENLIQHMGIEDRGLFRYERKSAGNDMIGSAVLAGIFLGYASVLASQIPIHQQHVDAVLRNVPDNVIDLGERRHGAAPDFAKAALDRAVRNSLRLPAHPQATTLKFDAAGNGVTLHKNINKSSNPDVPSRWVPVPGPDIHVNVPAGTLARAFRNELESDKAAAGPIFGAAAAGTIGMGIAAYGLFVAAGRRRQTQAVLDYPYRNLTLVKS